MIDERIGTVVDDELFFNILLLDVLFDNDDHDATWKLDMLHDYWLHEQITISRNKLKLQLEMQFSRVPNSKINFYRPIITQQQSSRESTLSLLLTADPNIYLS